MYTHKKFLKFAISGGAAVMLNIALLYVFVRWFGIWYLSASIFAFVLSMLAHFTLQKIWVFVSRAAEEVHVQFLKFCVMATLNLVINTICLYALASLLGVNYLIAQTILRFALAIMNYFSYEFFVFLGNSNHGKA